MPMHDEIIVYAARMCGDCQNLKAFMDKHDVPYVTRDIHENPEHRKILEAKTGKLGVPYLVINGEWKRGYEPGKPFSEAFARDLLGMRN